MSLLGIIKNIRIVRGLYFLHNMFLGWKRNKFGHLSKNVSLTPPIYGDYHNVFIYDHVGIGPYAYLSSPNAKIIIKGNCAIADHLTIHTGNHARILGKFVTGINETNKPKGYDNDVIIERDVWIGCNVTILAGVHIGRGATIAAGAIVNKNIPPYCIAAGIPAKPIKFYWSIEQILEHEKCLYPEDDRFSRNELKIIMETNEDEL